MKPIKTQKPLEQNNNILRLSRDNFLIVSKFCLGLCFKVVVVFIGFYWFFLSFFVFASNVLVFLCVFWFLIGFHWFVQVFVGSGFHFCGFSQGFGFGCSFSLCFSLCFLRVCCPCIGFSMFGWFLLGCARLFFVLWVSQVKTIIKKYKQEQAKIGGWGKGNDTHNTRESTNHRTPKNA